MTMHRISTLFRSLIATAALGSLFGLFLMGVPAMDSLNRWMSDVQSCLEQHGTLTCGIHHVVGARMFATFAVGALVATICALPVLGFSVKGTDGVFKSALLGFGMGAIVYISVKLLGLVDGFLFADLVSLCFLGTCAALMAWCTSRRQSLAITAYAAVMTRN